MYQEIFNEALQKLNLITEGVNNPWTVWIPLLGVFAALFLGAGGGDWIESWFKKPKLKISIKVAPPDCHKTFFNNSQTGQYLCDTYYFRFRVENNGNYYAENVEAMVFEVFKKENDGSNYNKIDTFLPLNIVWSHCRTITVSKIQPKLFKHLDLGYVIKSNFAGLERFRINSSSKIVFKFDVAVEPNTGSHILVPGDYKIKIIFAANNHKPVEKIYSLTIKDAGSDDEGEMLSSNVLIKEESYV
jgi:hypothetical protein